MVTKTQKMRDDIFALNNVLKSFIEETIGAIKNKKSQNRISVGPLKDDMDQKIKKFKDIKEDFFKAKDALEEVKKLTDMQVIKYIVVREKRKD